MRALRWVFIFVAPSLNPGASAAEPVGPIPPRSGAIVGTIDAKPVLDKPTESWHPRLVWSPDGRFLAAGGRDGQSSRIEVWTVEGEKINADTPAFVVKQGTPHNVDLAWSPDGQFLAANRDEGDGCHVLVWAFRAGVAPGKPLLDRIVRKFSSEPPSWSPDGKFLASTAWDEEGDSLVVWERDGGKFGDGKSIREAKNKLHRGGLVWSPDGRFLAAEFLEGDERCLAVWARAKGITAGTEVLKTKLGEGNAFLSWSPNGRFLAVGCYFFSEGGRLALWGVDPDGNTLKGPVRDVSLPTGASGSPAWRPDSRLFALGLEPTPEEKGGGVRVWAADGEPNGAALALPPGFFLAQPAWSADGRLFAVSGVKPKGPGWVSVWGGKDPTSAKVPVFEAEVGERMPVLSWSPGGHSLAVRGWAKDGWLHVWAVQNGKIETRPKIDTELGVGAGKPLWSPDGRFLAGSTTTSPGEKGRVVVWAVRPRFWELPGPPEGLAFVGDNRLAALVGGDTPTVSARAVPFDAAEVGLPGALPKDPVALAGVGSWVVVAGRGGAQALPTDPKGTPGKVVPNVDGPDAIPLAVAAAGPDRVVLGGGARQVRLFSVDEEGTLTEVGAGPRAKDTDEIRAVAASRDGKALASGHDDGQVWVWRRNGNQVEAGEKVGRGEGRVTGVAFGPDGGSVVSVHRGTGARAWKATGGEVKWADGSEEAAKGVVAVASGGSRVVVVSGDGRVWAFALGADGRGVLSPVLARGVSGVGPVTHMAVDPSGRWMALAAKDPQKPASRAWLVHLTN